MEKADDYVRIGIRLETEGGGREIKQETDIIGRHDRATEVLASYLTFHPQLVKMFAEATILAYEEIKRKNKE